MSKWIKRISIDALIVFSAVAFVSGLLALMPPRMPVSITPADFGMPQEDIEFSTADGVNIKGWLVHSEKSNAIIICLHGYPANRSDILPVISFLYPDFSLLFLDFRAHGESTGRITHFGLKETLDVKAAINFISGREKTRDLRIGVWGYSMGGAIALLSASKQKEIEAVATDSAFANFPDMVRQYYGNMGPLKHLFYHAASLMGKIVLRSGFTGNSPEHIIAKIRSPILLIHSRDDRLVPYSHAKTLFKRATGEKTLFPLAGEHASIGKTMTPEYRKKIFNFFSKHLGKESKSFQQQDLQMQ